MNTVQKPNPEQKPNSNKDIIVGPVPFEKHYEVFTSIQTMLKEHLASLDRESLLIGLRVVYDELDSSSEPDFYPYSVESGYLELVDNAIKCGMGEDVSEEELIEKTRNAPIPITLLDEMYQFAYSELQAASNTKLRVGVFTEAKSNPIYYAGNACGCSSDTKKRKRFAGTSTTGKTIPSCGSTCP
ncbi:MAG: hypothetical protein IPO22_15245 [Anaerolineales bacterium]|nr:hypothetical protein [Anaerolineales bacterium]